MQNDSSQLITKYSKLAEALFPRLTDFAINLAAAFGIVIAGWLAARIICGVVERLLTRSTRIDPTIKPFISNVVRYSILIVVLFAAVERLGVQATSILAVIGAAGLAIGLALQGTLSNVAAGVMLLVLRPLRIDEYVDADGIVGTVREVGLFNTLLHSADGISLYVPNAKLWSATIKNYSRLGRRRLDINFRIAYERDVDQALAVLDTMLKQHKDVLTDPPPAVVVTEFADVAVLCTMQVWVRASNYIALSTELRRAAKRALDEADIGMAHGAFLFSVPDELKSVAKPS